MRVYSAHSCFQIRYNKRDRMPPSFSLNRTHTKNACLARTGANLPKPPPPPDKLVIVRGKVAKDVLDTAKVPDFGKVKESVGI